MGNRFVSAGHAVFFVLLNVGVGHLAVRQADVLHGDAAVATAGNAIVADDDVFHLDLQEFDGGVLAVRLEAVKVHGLELFSGSAGL